MALAAMNLIPDTTKPRIAIPVPTSSNPSYNERCWKQYAAAISSLGGEPVAIPLGLPPAETAQLANSCAGIVLPGSPADVHPQKYGQHAHAETAPADFGREATDELLLQDAFHLHKPILGICFGLQMMNVWRGGSLVQHLQTELAHSPLEDQVTIEHALQLQADAQLLPELARSEADPVINSSHHQAVDLPGDGLRVAARAADGVVEALEGTQLEEQFVLGVQWHPERSFAMNETSRNIFSAFLEAARQWHLPRG
jgi:putative glutamine amidotransferase